MSEGSTGRALPSIESLATPLAFKVGHPSQGPADAERLGEIQVRSEFRALEGMQKEALVHHGPSATLWRMVSDEGPYLKGTDLAPFPLAFYTAGIVFSFMTEMLRHAAERDVKIASLALTSDHYYTMQGSALRGDMIGGAKPIEMTVDAETDAPEQEVRELVEAALASSPAEAYMRQPLENTFSLTANGRALDLPSLRQSSSRRAERLGTDFDQIEPLESGSPEEIIAKLTAAEVVHGVDGGAGSSLKPVQDRTLHVRGEARVLSETLKEIRVRLLRPIGSSFRFLGEDGGSQQAPPALAYLSAGVGFCYMTQLGRYAQITKKAPRSYGIVQENVFHSGATRSSGESVPATAEAVDTGVVLEIDQPDEIAQKMVFMGERTCFLHAAMRGAHPTRVRVGSSTAGETGDGTDRSG